MECPADEGAAGDAPSATIISKAGVSGMAPPYPFLRQHNRPTHAGLTPRSHARQDRWARPADLSVQERHGRARMIGDRTGARAVWSPPGHCHREEIEVRTPAALESLDVTARMAEVVDRSGIAEGLV